jgi:metal transporter CNNM
METSVAFLLAGVLIFLSAICSGLNVALLSLNLQDLRRKAKLGDAHAKRALPIRRKVHFFLSGILLANVAFASSAAIVLGDAFSGLFAVFISTILLVVFAEITPQAIAVSRAMKAVSIFADPIRFFTYLGYPLTKPLALLLDKLVGKSKVVLHTRNELSLLVADHLVGDSELDEDEVEIVQNAIQLSEKRVRDIMTPLKNTYFLFEDEVIDHKKIDELKRINHSRLPIFNKEKTQARSYLMMKDLIDIDFSERAYTLKELKTYKTKTVGSMTALDTMFRIFIAAKRHLLIVEKDDKVLGIVTLEDMIEETIGHEIEDEGDSENGR